MDEGIVLLPSSICDRVVFNLNAPCNIFLNFVPESKDDIISIRNVVNSNQHNTTLNIVTGNRFKDKEDAIKKRLSKEQPS